MFSDNEQISTRQATRLLVFELLGMTTLLLPQLLAKYSHQDGVFALMVGIGFSLLYVKLLKRKNKAGVDIFTLLARQDKKKIIVIVRIFYCILFLCLAALTVYETARMVQHLLLRMDSFHLIAVILVVAAIYGIKQGMEGRARIFEVLFWFLLVPLILMLLFACKDVHTDYWCPIFSSDLGGFLKGAVLVFLFFHISSILILSEQKHVKKYSAMQSAIVVTGLFNLALYFILLGTFQWNFLSEQNHPAFVLMSMVRLPGGFMKRQDAVMAAVWFFSLYALMNAGIYQGSQQIYELFKKKNPQICRVIGAGITLLLTILMYKSKSVLQTVQNIILPVGGVISMLLIWKIGKEKGKSYSLQKRKTVQTLLITGCLLGSLFLGGCSKRELEKSSYPMAIVISNTQKGHLQVTFSFPKLGEKADQNVQQKESAFYTVQAADLSDAVTIYERNTDQSMDCNHVKALVFTTEIFKNKEEWTQILLQLKQSELLARNIPVFLTKDADMYLQGAKQTDTSPGEYLEGLIQNQTQRKNTDMVTIGTLLMQLYSENETIFLPKITIQRNVPIIGEYQAMRYMEDAGVITKSQQEMASLIEGKQNRYSYYLKDKTHVQLSDIRIRRYIEETSNGVQQTIKILANAVPVSGKFQEKKKQKEAERELKLLLEETTKVLKENKLDLTNSYVRLGAKSRKSWMQYRKNRDGYEKKLKTKYEVKLDFVTDEN